MCLKWWSGHFQSVSCDVLLLFLEQDLYAAAPLDADGGSLQFRRKAGDRTNVWMHDSWVSGKNRCRLLFKREHFTGSFFTNVMHRAKQKRTRNVSVYGTCTA